MLRNGYLFRLLGKMVNNSEDLYHARLFHL
ncbi:unnamed protein product [Onchocerca flexuosa]|uniref:Transposase n=1 Tax=Onchocerca flexuosa TaxID=387005 RepID=A0A183HBP0_9BILA|nr:unnamed protein product [Onchocerca flexuosa]